MIPKEEAKRLSKLLSYVLRHNPAHLDIQLDEQGWTDVKTLIGQLNRQPYGITLDSLKQVVETNDKKRFNFNEDYSLIRASQGHSLKVELNYAAQKPPQVLFHGTAEKFLPAIMQDGLLKMERHHVHLSAGRETATEVGGRRGKPVVLTIDALEMYEDEHEFFLSDNGVWLTEHVPVAFIKL